MTKVGKRTWVRETDSAIYECGQLRNVVVSLVPGGVINLRLKGTRRSYDITAASMYIKAMQAVLFKEKMEKAKARKFRAKRSRV